MKVRLQGKQLILFSIILILITLMFDISVSLIVGTLFTFILKAEFIIVFLKLMGFCICFHLASFVRSHIRGFMKFENKDSPTLIIDLEELDDKR